MSTIAPKTKHRKWDWSQFHGSAEALKWNRRDVDSIEAILAYVPGRKVCVQAGGNLGIFPKRLSEDFETVYTFEPAPDLFQMLCHNAPEKNIVKFQCAVGATRGRVGLSRVRRDGKPNNHEGITHVSGEGNVPTLLIDDLGLEVCDLIYLDVEGWELYALEGAKATIKYCRPALCVEINKHIRETGWTPDHLRGLIRLQGYRHVLSIHSDELYLPMEEAA